MISYNSPDLSLSEQSPPLLAFARIAVEVMELYSQKVGSRAFNTEHQSTVNLPNLLSPERLVNLNDATQSVSSWQGWIGSLLM